MIQRDLIQQQIEQLGRTIGKIITGFLGLRTQGKVALGFEIANEQFNKELDIDIDKLLGMDKAVLSDYLKERQFTDVHLVQIADYVEVLGAHQSDNTVKANAFNTSLNLLAIANEKSAVYDMNRQFKVKAIEQKIKDLVHDRSK